MKKLLRNLLVIAAAFTLSCQSSYAQIIPYVASIHTPYQGTAVTIGQPNAAFALQAAFPIANEQDIQVLNRISLEVDQHYEAYFGTAFETEVTVKVKRWDVNNQSIPDTTISLSIAYNPFADTNYRAIESARFKNCYRIELELLAISVDQQAQQDLPANLIIKGEILIEKQIAFTNLSSPIVFNPILEENMDCDQAGTIDQLTLSWDNSIAGILEYQLEYVYINDYSDILNVDKNEAALGYNFKYNSTRISTSNNEYKINLLFDKGWLLYRVRGVGVNANGETVFGAWNLSEAGTVNLVPADQKFHITAQLQHEKQLNWQLATTFAEQGKKKEVISYADGSLRNRQMVTQVNSDQNVIVGETIYDHQGRPAIQVLPTPVPQPWCQVNDPFKSASIHFYANFNQNAATEGYSRLDFDLSPQNTCVLQAQPMSVQSGASNYYSTSNPNQTAEQGYVPDAQEFPFSQIEYTPDNTGRISKQGGVGSAFQLGSGHEATYLYSKPNQLELDRLFGSEVGYHSHYQKNAVIDANGQASVSYLDQEGRVIATALGGDAPSNLLAIESEENAAVELTIDAFDADSAVNTIDINGEKIQYSSFFTLVNSSDVVIDYAFQIDPLNFECLPDICVNCVYDLSISLLNDCAQNVLTGAITNKLKGHFQQVNGVYSFHPSCQDNNAGSFTPETLTAFNLPIGTYQLVKDLTINADARQQFIDMYLDTTLNTCVQTLYDFQQEALAAIDFTDCEITCESCLNDLGTLDDYIASNLGTANDYYEELKNCQDICDSTFDPCRFAYELFQMDMTPGGQYAEYLNQNNQIDPSQHNLSIFNANTLLNTYGNSQIWQHPKLIDAFGEHPIYLDANGDTSRLMLQQSAGVYSPQPLSTSLIKFNNSGQPYIYPQELANVNDFINSFESSWAKSLIKYHPEFCYYKTCLSFGEKLQSTDAYSSQSFDELLLGTNTFEEAVNAHLLPAGYQPIFSQNGQVSVGSAIEPWWVSSTTHAWDPFMSNMTGYATSTCGLASTEMYDRFMHFQQIGGVWRSAIEVAAFTARCGNNIYSNPNAACFDFGGLYNGTYEIAILNNEWNNLRMFYASIKQQLQHEISDCIALEECTSYCGCIGNENFNPFTTGLFDASNLPFSFSSSAFMNPSQPCNFALANEYEQKDRRFAAIQDVIPNATPNQSAYQLYLSTGQCPIEFTFQNLLSELASVDQLDNNNVHLNDFSGLLSMYYANNNYASPGTIPDLYQQVNISGNTLTLSWIENPTSNIIASITLTKSSSAIAWDDINEIYHLYHSSSSTFHAEGIYVANGLNQTLQINGNMVGFDLANCNFQSVGTQNQFGADLQNILSALAANQLLTSTTAVDIDPLANTSYTGLQTLSIENAIGGSQPFDVFWISDNLSTYHLFNANMNTQDGLYIQFDPNYPPGFNWNDINLVQYFDNMVSTGGYTFEIDAHLSNNSTVHLKGDVLRIVNGQNQIGIPVGSFGLPVPMECRSDEHEAFNSLEDLLKECLPVSSGVNLNHIDWFTSIYLDHFITDQFEPGVHETISEYNSNLNQVTITAGSCKTILKGNSANSISHIASVESMEVVGYANVNQAYNQFILHVTFDNGVQGIVTGQTCLNLKECRACDSTGINIIALDTIRMERLQSGQFYIDQTIDQYALYTNAIDSFNVVHNLTALDTNYIETKDYYYFTKNGFHFPTPAYLHFMENAIIGIDNLDYLKDPMMFAANYGYATNVLFEYARYLEGIQRYNLRAQDSLAPLLSPISKEDFVYSRVARNNGEFLTYLEANPVGNQGANNILGFLNASTAASSQFEQMYQAYASAYLQFETANAQDTVTPCIGFEKEYPMYAYEDILEKNVLNSIEGQQLFWQYVNSFSNQDCPGILPEKLDTTTTAIAAFSTTRLDQKYYALYKEAIWLYNQSYWATSNGHELKPQFLDATSYMLNDYDSCLHEYLIYLYNYSSSQNANSPMFPPLNITEFGPCNGILLPEDPCREAYSQYLSCAYDYNKWANNNGYYLYEELATYDAFKELNLCNCVDEFCARLNNVKDGLIWFGFSDSLYLYLEPTQICDKPCVIPEDTLGPINEITVQLPDPCEEALINNALMNAQNQYAQYIDSLVSSIAAQYNSHCLSVAEQMNYTYTEKLYHYTLYYYDQAGNLIKTVPPEGVNILPITSSSDLLEQQIIADRKLHQKKIFTSHRLATTYQYNSLNQLVSQKSPDTDPMKVFELQLTNGLHPRLVTNQIQMLDNQVGYLAGEVPTTNGVNTTRGYLYKTTDAGHTWNRVYGLVGADLKKTVMVNAQTGFAVGTDGIVLKTLDGGQTWDLLPTWTAMSFLSDILDIDYLSAVNNNQLIFVGKNGLIAKSTDFINFTLSNTGIAPTATITSITHDLTKHYVSVFDGIKSQIYERAFAASTWSPIGTFTAPELTCIDQLTDNSFVAAGKDARLYRYDPNSSTLEWQLIDHNIKTDIQQLAFFNLQQGMALSNQKLYRTADGGQTWTELPQQNVLSLQRSADRTTISVSTANGQLLSFVPSSNILNSPIQVNHTNGTASIESIWTSHVQNGNYVAAPMSFASGNSLFVTNNAYQQLPSWVSAALPTGEIVKDIQLKSQNGSGLGLKGAILCQSGTIYTIDWAAFSTTISIQSALSSIIDMHMDAANDKITALNATGQLYTLDLTALPNGWVQEFSGITGSYKALYRNGSAIQLVGIDKLKVQLGAAPSTTNLTNAIVPSLINHLFTHPNTAQIIALGSDGQLYVLENQKWKHKATNTNANLKSIAWENGSYFIAGSAGFLFQGTIFNEQFSASELMMNTGHPVSQDVTEDLNSLVLVQGKMYVVGQNGCTLYSPQISNFGLAKTYQGNQTLNHIGVYSQSGTTKFLSCGLASTVLSHVGGSTIARKDLFLTGIKDVQFSSSTNGTLLAGNSTLRKMNTNQQWKTIKPDASSTAILSSQYTKVWSVSATKSLVVGVNAGAMIQNETASITTSLPTNVVALAANQNSYYFAKANAVVAMTISSSGSFGTPTTYNYTGQQINSIDVLDNNDFAVAGENGFFAYQGIGSGSVFTASIQNADINVLKFVDHVYAVAAGDNGAYYKFNATGMTPYGYATAGTWAEIQDVYASANDPYLVDNATDIDIYALDFASYDQAVFGGKYLSGFGVSNPLHCYVRFLHDPNAKYSSRFFYDRLGRLIVSQNARQFNASPKKYSYSLYDELGRVVEAGEKTENPANVLQFKGIFGTLVSGYYNPITVNDSLLSVWVRGGGARKEVTKSYYDQTAFNNVPNFNPNILTQRKRIVHVAYYEVLDTNHLEAYDHATHYDYDIHGNVKTLIQDNQKMEENFPSLAFQRYKQVDYTYDLISGNVHRVSVQTGHQDQWHHAYQYDADNRITNAYTNKETPILSSGLPIALENELLQNTDWQRDARYHYYDHGPLSRTELGKDMLQGLDYTYTLQGWMKGINATSLDSLNDPGLDAASGLANNPNSWFAKDVMSFGLHYYTGDYTPISTTLSGSAQANIVGSDVANYGADLYNGNIRAMQTTLTHPTTYQVLPQANAYEYDQLNRLKSSRSFTNLSANNWQSGSVYSNKYFNTFEYDAMGNILTQKRHKQDGTQIEDMTYRYQRDANGFLLSNRLYHVNDAIASTVDQTDIDDQGAGFDPLNININGAYNYVYDEEGRLIKDKSEDIQQIVWRVDGKVKEINRSTGSTMPRLKFDYDAMGRRIAKHVYNNQTGLLEKSTYYLLDAQGNTMATYDYAQAPNQTMSFQLKERHIYGSSRLGMYAESVVLVENPSTENNNTVVNQGFKQYEMTNHLGNVLTVIHDIKIPLNNGSGPAVSSYRVGIRTCSDYSPFGVELDGRTVSGGYRYGFNGMEADDEIKGTKNSYDFWARMYDPRIGRWLTIDPQAREYPDLNPYNFVENSPMIMNDPTGESGIVTIDKEARNITIEANIVLYGTSATAELAQSTAKDVQDTWNAADGRVMIDGIEYCVNFVITAEYQPTLTPAEVSANTDYKNNYIRVEETNSKGVSYMVGSSSGGGSNSGYYLLKNITADKSTTEGHEMGHGWGLDIAEYGTKDGHPADRDLRGQGQPGIMYARGTLVDPDYQWDPKAAAGAPGGTVNPDKRKVLQSDIDGLHLDKLTFDANGQANLGKLTNTYIPK
jgi:RHS repeat-associated protein